jgi:hypothetical protein
MFPNYTPEERIEAFWQKVDRSGGDNACWLWTGSTFRNKYGRLRWCGHIRKAHRVSYLIAHGELPDDLCVLHSCDNPQCVNPAHLSLGTPLDNASDRVAKGRSGKTYGPRYDLRRLSEAQYAEIRRRYNEGGVSQQALAAEFGVGQMTISRAVHRKT